MVADHVAHPLCRAQHAYRLATDAALRSISLTTPQYTALSAIGEEPGVSGASLSRRCFVTPQTMNEIVATLEGAGYIKKQPHPAHRRIIQLSLAPTGQKLLQRARRLVEEVEEQMVTGLSDRQQRQMSRWLQQCSEILESGRGTHGRSTGSTEPNTPAAAHAAVPTGTTSTRPKKALALAVTAAPALGRGAQRRGTNGEVRSAVAKDGAASRPVRAARAKRPAAALVRRKVGRTKR